MKCYKLTDKAFRTRRNTVWGENVTHTVEGELEMCCNGLHAYTHPVIAVFMNPLHASVINPILWECKSGQEKLFEGTKLCFRKLTTVRIVELPEITTEQRVEIAIRLALLHKGRLPESWITWANNWLSNKDRTAAAAYAAAAYAAAANAANAAYAAAANAAYAAAAAAAANAAYAAAANAAYAAYAAANAAYAANAAAFNRRFIRIIKKVVG